MRITIDDRGLRKLLREIDEFALDGLRETGDEMARVARELVPIDTSALQGSTRVEDAPDPLTVLVISGGEPYKNIKTDDDVDYAPYVEFGTSKARAQPYMTPASQATDGTNEVGRAVRELVRESGI